MLIDIWYSVENIQFSCRDGVVVWYGVARCAKPINKLIRKLLEAASMLSVGVNVTLR